jgi:hypothetical protein
MVAFSIGYPARGYSNAETDIGLRTIGTRTEISGTLCAVIGTRRAIKALETAVFNELQRRGADVEYIKTADGFEVDFHVLHRGGDRSLLQVCADPASEQTRTREFRALGSAAKENPKLPPMLLVLTQEQAAALSAEPFRIVPAYEWILEQ